MKKKWMGLVTVFCTVGALCFGASQMVEAEGIPQAKKDFVEESEESVTDEEVKSYSSGKEEVQVSQTEDGRMVIVLDPGHDSFHGGASVNGINEGEANLAIALACKAKLETYEDVVVYLTRSESTCPFSAESSSQCLIERVNYANLVGADLFVSLHNNSSTSPDSSGSIAFVTEYGPYKSMTEIIGSNILAQLTDVGLKSNGCMVNNDDHNNGTYDDGTWKDDYYVMRGNISNGIPALLIEHAFLTNTEDAAMLADAAKLKAIGEADAVGIAQSYGWEIEEKVDWIECSAGENKVDLAWEPFEGATFYRILKSTEEDGTYQACATVSTETHYTDTYIQDSGTYYYKIQAVLANGDTVESDAQEVEVTVVLRLTATPTKKGTIQLLWNDLSRATSYKITRSTKKNGNYKTLVTMQAGNARYEDTDVVLGKAYYYKVSMIERGSSGYRGETDYVKGCALKTPEITSVSSEENGGVKIGWGKVKHATGYIVYRSTSRGGQYMWVATISSGDTLEYIDTKVSKGTYFYKVTARYKSGTRTAKTVKSKAAKVVLLEKEKIKKVTVSASNEVTLQWKRLKKATGYQVKRSTSPNGGFKTIAKIDGNRNTSYTDTKTAKNTTYYYRIVAVNEGVVSSTTSKSEVVGTNALGTPVIGTIQTTAKNKLKLSWSKVNGADGYIISKSTKKNGEYSVIKNIASGDKLSYTDKKVSQGVTYFYKIQAYGNTGDHTYVTGRTGTFQKGKTVGGAALLAAEENDHSQIAISFQKTKGADGYEILRSTEEKGQYEVIADVTNATSYNDSTAALNTSYYYKVRSYIDLKKNKSYGVTTAAKSAIRKCSVEQKNEDTEGKTVQFVVEFQKPQGNMTVTAMTYTQMDSSQVKTYTAVPSADKKTYTITVSGADFNGYEGTYFSSVYAADGSGTVLLKQFENAFDKYTIMGSSSVSVAQMVAHYQASGKAYPGEVYAEKGASNIQEFCQILYDEANAEGVRAEVLYAQVIHETGYLQFGGQVASSQCNFGGIGATDGGAAGATFADVRTGLRAQTQHLKAYGSTDALKQTCVDPRFNGVTRGCAVYVEWLGMKENPTGKGWATAEKYGYKLRNYINQVKA